MSKRVISHKQWKWFTGLVVCFLLVMLVLYVRMTSVRSSALESDFKRKPQPVKIIYALFTDEWKTVSFLARVEGGQTIQIRSEVGGWVSEKKVEIGDKVAKDDTLLVLRDQRKELSLLEAKSRLNAAKANLKELKRLYNKNISLVDKGIVAKDTLESLNNQIASKQAEVNALDAVYQRSNWDFEHLSIKSPIEGEIMDVLPDIGQEVMPGEMVINLVNSEQKKIVAGVNANWARELEKGTQVRLTNEVNGTEQISEGVIKGISPNIDRATGTYLVEAQLTDKKNSWLPGEIINMEVPVELLKNVVKVPRSAVLSDNKDVFVFTYEDDKAEKVPVEVSWLNDEYGVIPSQNIKENSKIIVEGNSGLSDKQSIRLLN